MTTYINQLTQLQQDAIEEALQEVFTQAVREGQYTADESLDLIEEAMHSKISDLEDTINIHTIIDANI